jgi:NAD+ diphosphatase
MLDAPAFTAFPLDRAEALRRDADAVASLAARPDARVAALWRLKPLVGDQDGALTPAYFPRSRLDPASLQSKVVVEVFLGLDAAGAPVFAVALDPALEPPPDFAALVMGGESTPDVRFVELREAAATMHAGEASILATARALFAWHEAHGFCPKCGAPSVSTLGGWKRVCSVEGTEHFPRVDPVVIMLITRDEQALLGRGVTWPEGRFSCLAGFVEPGETAEDAARREAQEETGILLGEVGFLMSQPWPFPSQLMLGLHAQALSEAIIVDPHELAEARWASRAEVEAMLAGKHPSLRGPPPFAVAYHLLRWWVSRPSE